MCETCLSKLHSEKAFIGRIPKPDEVLANDVPPEEVRFLNELYFSARPYFDRYLSSLGATALSHEPKERKNAVAKKPQLIEEDISPLEEPGDNDEREEVA